MLKLLIVSFLVSVSTGLLMLRREYQYCRLFVDCGRSERHKIHRHVVPRLGGLAVFAGLVVALLSGWVTDLGEIGLLLPLLVAALPVYLVGLLEDLHRQVRPRVRLIAAFASAILGIVLAGALMVRLDLPIIDTWLLWTPFAVAMTVFAVGGVSNAFNIVDGLNGLAGGIAVLVLAALTYLSLHFQDVALANVGMITIGAVMGFLFWNYPSGQLFLGDAGAYLLGFLIAEMSLLLVLRHPEVSAWFPLALIVYPVWETVFSIYRRKVIRKLSAATADRLHMHTLLYKRLPYGISYRGVMGRCRQRNADATPYAWLLALLGVVPAVLFWDDPLRLQLAVLAFCLFYVWYYRRLVRFRASLRPAARAGQAGELAQPATSRKSTP